MLIQEGREGTLTATATGSAHSAHSAPGAHGTAAAHRAGSSHQVQAGAVGADLVEGPLKGYHHQTYAVRLDPNSPLAKDFTWLKLREPREGVLWYDMRWFPSEEMLLPLLREQHGRELTRIPRVGVQQGPDGEPMTFLGFIEGVSLNRARGNSGRGAGSGRGGGAVAERFLRQIVELFGALAAADAEALVGYGGPQVPDCPECDLTAWPEQGGCTDFLGRLTHFTLAHAYAQGPDDLVRLLADLEVPATLLDAFGRRRPTLTDRPRTLLHGDLHRKNFIVDRAGALWTIDWELALVGDPAYDLATHLHLMNYPKEQEQDVIARWERGVGPDASAGVRGDLPHYRAYKRVQSLCTDVFRAATRLKESADEPGAASGRARLHGAAALMGQALEAAGPDLGNEKTMPRPAVELVLQSWWERHRAEQQETAAS